MALLKAVFGGGDRSGEGVPARAVVRWGHCGLEPGSRSNKVRTKLELTLADGSSAKVVEGLPWKLAVALCSWNHVDAPDWTDTDIAIRVDADTGEVLGLDRPAVERELAERFEVIDRSWSLSGQVRQEVEDLKQDVTGIAELPGALADAARAVRADLSAPVDDEVVLPEHLQISDEDPDLAPVEGVTFERWLEVQGAMLREKVKPKRRFEYAESHGIPAGRWDAITAEWMQRAQRNQALAVRLAQGMEQARRGN